MLADLILSENEIKTEFSITAGVVQYIHTSTDEQDRYKPHSSESQSLPIRIRGSAQII